MPALPTAKPGLSVFLPAYNDSGTIASLVITSLKTAARLTPDFEVIIGDDGSTENLEAVVEAVADRRVRIARREVNGGIGAGRNVRRQLDLEDDLTGWPA